MRYTEKEIDDLRLRVKARLSEKRFIHTLGVERMAVRIGEKCLPDKVSQLRVAALLHDISKEYSEAEYFEIAKRHNVSFSEEDLSAPALWHSITAPLSVLEYFPAFADDEVLSAVYNHTVGSPDMTVFDEIILLSDYIEDGRSYKNCVMLRESFLSELDVCDSIDKSVMALHRAVLKSLDNNINEFISRGKEYHSRTKLTRDEIFAKIERQNNGDN
jgi:predicted HD superfamily hydrolase involved in NAD metabolism